jgi:hypothetical protein
MTPLRWSLIAAVVLAGSAAGAVYTPRRGVYNSDRDPATIVRAGNGIGTIRFGQPVGGIPVSAFGRQTSTRRIYKAALKTTWIRRDFGPISVIGKTGGRHPIVAFLIRGNAYRTPNNFGIGSNVQAAKVAFGPGTQLKVRGKLIPVREYRRYGTRVLVQTGRPPKKKRTVVAWALSRDPKLTVADLLPG